MKGVALELTSFQILNYGLNDFDIIVQRSSNGWYWGAIPSLFIGLSIRWLALGALYATNRTKQAKKSLQYVLKRQVIGRLWFCVYMAILLGLIAGSVFFIVHENRTLPKA